MKLMRTGWHPDMVAADNLRRQSTCGKKPIESTDGIEVPQLDPRVVALQTRHSGTKTVTFLSDLERATRTWALIEKLPRTVGMRLLLRRIGRYTLR